MKKFFSAALLLLAGYTCLGQAFSSTVKVAREQQPAAVIELPYSSDIVSDALAAFLLKKGRSKGSDIRGFTTFRNTQASGVNGNADLYFKVERKSRQEKGATLVTLLLTAPKADGIADSLHYLNMEEAKAYLNELVPAIAAYNLEQTIRNQNELVARAEGRYKNLVEDGTDLERKRVNIEKNIADNKTAVQNQAAEVAIQKQKLADLVGQRKN
ncbi:MAG: hypothetical protein EOO15_09915 [Chitinophagaceae bacterium]|nr:MAG: hypothetical protein EOO15_09915 [Chitinophagaceae bacterium]